MHFENMLVDNDLYLDGCYIEVTSKCNLRCIHCYNNSGEEQQVISLEAFKNVLGCYENPQNAVITISGGEPLMHPNIWTLIDMCCEHGIQPNNVLLITNATNITPDIAEKLAKSNISVQISINGSMPETHDPVCGKGSFKRTIDGLDNLIAMKSNYIVVRFMMNKYNLHDIIPFIKFVIAKGVTKVLLASVKPVGRASDCLDSLECSPDALFKTIDELNNNEYINEVNNAWKKAYGENETRISIPVPYSGVCPLVIKDEKPVPLTPRIDAKGDVYLCQSFFDEMYSFGNINLESLEAIMSSNRFANLANFMATGANYIRACKMCALQYSCVRGCIGDCIANGSIHETDGTCYYRKASFIQSLLNKPATTAIL